MRNKLSDLNNILFEQLERLNDDELTDDELAKEINRSRSLTRVAQTIINNQTLVFDVLKHVDEYGKDVKEVPRELITYNEED